MSKNKIIQISDYLKVGQENATPISELAKLIGCTTREIQTAVERERRQGSPICAVCTGKPHGLYLASGPGEMGDYCARLMHRSEEIEITLKACRETTVRMSQEAMGKNNPYYKDLNINLLDYLEYKHTERGA